MSVTYQTVGTTLKFVYSDDPREDIIVPKGITTIASCAIRSRCDCVTLTIPDSVKTINEHGITGSFKKIVFSKNIELLDGKACFGIDCKSPVIVPPKVVFLNDAFGLSSFAEVFLPEGLLSLNGTFHGNPLLTKVHFPSTLTYIGDDTFSDCTQLETFILPPSIEYIGKNAFSNTKVKGEFFLPKSLKEIGKNAFPNKECTFYIEGNGENIKTSDWHHPQARVFFNATKESLTPTKKIKESSNVKKLEIPIPNELYQRYLKALDGDGYEMYYLGFCYEYGKDVAKDMKRALYWYSEATIEESGAGIFALAKCYEEGKGVEINFDKAFKLYQKGADLHHDKSLCSLGNCYYEGKGVKQDYTVAYQCYVKAVELGNVPALYNVGLCYEHGYGVKKDLKKALKYYKEAYDKGYQAALNKIKKLK